MTESHPSGNRIAVAGALLLYLALAITGAIRNAEQINPDGVSYIRLAGYLAAGRLQDSISSCWGPLISWSMAPLLAVGVDGLHAARAVLVVWGALLVLASALLMRRFAPTSALHAFVILSIVAVVAARQASVMITPDVIVAAFLLLYFWSSGDPALLSSRRRQFSSGLWAGIAYLAKAYALPFFLVHIVFTIGLRHFVRRPEKPGPKPGFGRPLAALATALLGFAVVAGPWIGVLSWRYGEFTYQSSGRMNHAFVGPGDVPRALPHHVGLWNPPPGRFYIGEVLETLPVRDWSPFESREYFIHQCSLIVWNVAAVRDIFLEYDLAGLALCLLMFSPVLAFLVRDDADWRWCALWYAGTVVLYVSGYALVRGPRMPVEDRFFMPVLWPVACICSSYLCLSILRRIRPGRALGILCVALLFASLGLRPADRMVRGLSAPLNPPYRSIAHSLADLGCSGPVASTDLFKGIFVSYHMNARYLASPRSRIAGECAEELDEHGANTFLVWPASPLWDAFDNAPSWALRTTLPGPDGKSVKAFTRKP